MDGEPRVIFVYNADSGPLAQLKDYVHKIVSPQTYPCSLCQVTYGNLGMKRAWRRFVQELPHPAVFLHRDELAVQRPNLTPFELPAVLMEVGEDITLLVSAEELNQTPDIEALQSLVLARLRDRAASAAV